MARIFRFLEFVSTLAQAQHEEQELPDVKHFFEAQERMLCDRCGCQRHAWGLA